MGGRQQVFVYGTLKRGGSNHAFMAGQTFCGEARTVPGYRLIHLGDFPGMVSAAEDREGVSGEVWLVSADTLARLDELEGISEGLYRRERIQLEAPFGNQEVETYIYAGSTSGRAIVSGGKWNVAEA